MTVVPAPRPLLGAVLLLFVSAAWGSAFPLMKDLIERLPVEDLLAERYLIAALTLLLIKPNCFRGLPRGTWINGAVLGVIFGIGQTAQAIALGSLPSAVSGFAVGCSVVITPILALILFKSRVPRRIWAGVALALAGMTAFTLMRGVEQHEFSLIALAATLFAAGLYAGHTLMLGQLSKRGTFHPYALTVIQLFTIGLLTGVVGARDGITLPADAPDWLLLAHLSVISCALGFLARSYGQAHVPPVPSAIMMSSQPLWVAVIAVIWFNEQVGWSMVVGGGLMAGAMLLALPSRETVRGTERKRKNHDLLVVSRAAAKALADLKIKRTDPLRLDRGTAAPHVAKGACADVASCPWNTRSLKGGGEPSVERLIERATLIVRAKNLPGPGCCRSVTLLGRCLCDLMGESDQGRSTRLLRWFRSK
ncbi:DMT family transporter [Nonomuraea turcica]|uniref:DMT family transporter n=1 Tax=Nonomuraea sp. G32 TaxID=3067274 RepID=UPI00273B26A0|nr:DMT family transporter [Nonomuraea sp. G32]MDP4501518.1 DMT family transporter [Nonomuraea sp. G32]